MFGKFLAVILVSVSFFLVPALPARAGGMPFPVAEEKDEAAKMPFEALEEPGKMPVETDEPAEKMPVIEYDELVTDEEPEEERSRAWPWIIIGFLGTVLISAL